MSEKQARACVEKMKTDDAFRTKLLAITSPATRMQLINAAGFDCSWNEIAAASAELSDTELDSVAGGTKTMKDAVRKMLEQISEINRATNFS